MPRKSHKCTAKFSTWFLYGQFVFHLIKWTKSSGADEGGRNLKWEARKCGKSTTTTLESFNQCIFVLRFSKSNRFRSEGKFRRAEEFLGKPEFDINKKYKPRQPQQRRATNKPNKHKTNKLDNKQTNQQTSNPNKQTKQTIITK